MLFKFAFRNVLRNKKRSFLTALTIFFAAIVVGSAQAWVNGMLGVYMENYIRYQTGHIRITTDEFIKRQKFMPVNEIIDNSEEIIRKIKSIKEVESVNERIRFGILLGKDERTVQAVGVGVNLKDNKYKLGKKIIKGELKSSGIFIGDELAEKLRIKYGDAPLIATKTSEGGLNGIKLKVEGIFKFNMMYDKKLFFIGLADAKKLLKIYKGTTELFVFVKDKDDTDKIAAQIKKILPKGLAVQTYKKQLGNLYSTLQSTKKIYGFIEAIVLFLASFVIINTMMMAIFERLREIGTLKALGMTDRELFINFTLEGSIIGAAGGILGALVGFIIILIISRTGIDFTEQLKDMQMPIEFIIRPEVKFIDLLIAVIMSIVLPAMAAMIPSRYARKLMPAEALRK